MTGPDKHLVIVYHGNCIDGLAAAWALTQQRGRKHVSYVAYDHYAAAQSEKNLRAALKPASEIYFLDVAPRREFLDELVADQKTVHVLDHHETAARALAGYSGADITINGQEPSAAYLTWKKFMPAKAPPAFIGMIRKMDLGRELKTDADFAAAAFIDSNDISTVRKAFSSFSALSRMSMAEMTTAGKPLFEQQQKQIAQLDRKITYARLCLLPGTAPVEVPMVEADLRTLGRSVTLYLEKLGTASPSGMAAAWHINRDGSVSVSLRSNGTPDVSQVAEHLSRTMGISGGGHPTSAAVNFDTFKQFQAQMPLAARPKTAHKRHPEFKG